MILAGVSYTDVCLSTGGTEKADFINLLSGDLPSWHAHFSSQGFVRYSPSESWFFSFGMRYHGTWRAAWTLLVLGLAGRIQCGGDRLGRNWKKLAFQVYPNPVEDKFFFKTGRKRHMTSD